MSKPPWFVAMRERQRERMDADAQAGAIEKFDNHMAALRRTFVGVDLAIPDMSVPADAAYAGNHYADAAAYAMTAIESSRRCGKTEAQGVAIEAQRRLSGLVPAPDAAVPPERPIYRIPAHDVVPGMMVYDQGGWVTVTDVERTARFLTFGMGMHAMRAREDSYEVQLSGPSPRALACVCERYLPWEPHVDEPVGNHADECQVAPVPGRHGGLRLWPAPFRGTAWTWDGTWYRWGGWHVGPELIAAIGDGREQDPGWRDMGLQCFYLPPVQQPERRPAPAWDPYGTDLDLAVRYG